MFIEFELMFADVQMIRAWEKLGTVDSTWTFAGARSANKHFYDVFIDERTTKICKGSKHTSVNQGVGNWFPLIPMDLWSPCAAFAHPFPAVGCTTRGWLGHETAHRAQPTCRLQTSTLKVYPVYPMHLNYERPTTKSIWLIRCMINIIYS